MSESSSEVSSEYRAGDVVELFTGGPSMTIEQIDGSGEVPVVQCAWFECHGNEWGDLKRATFPINVLKDRNS